MSYLDRIFEVLGQAQRAGLLFFSAQLGRAFAYDYSQPQRDADESDEVFRGRLDRYWHNGGREAQQLCDLASRVLRHYEGQVAALQLLQISVVDPSRLLDDALSASELTHDLVHAGVEDGLVHVDPDTNLPYASDPESPKPQPNESSEAFHERADAFRRSLWRDEFRWARANLRRRMVDDLRYAFERPEAQVIALRALGVELVDVPVFDALIAEGLQQPISLVARGVQIPKALAQKASPHLSLAVQQHTGTTLSRWPTAIETLFASGMHRKEDGEVGLERVRRFVSLIQKATDDLPRQFWELSTEQLTQAERVLSPLRVNTIRSEFQPAAGRRGKMQTPWSAMHSFVEALGMGSMVPKRQSHRKRKK